MPCFFTKDPDAALDYGIDWEDWLNGDTIATSTWTVPAGLTEDSDSATATVATVWVSGGTAGTEYVLTNRIVTTNSPARTEERSITILVTER